MKLKLNDTIKRILVLLLIFAAIVAVVLRSGENLHAHNEQQMNLYIQNVIAQNVETVTVAIEKHQNFVESVAKDLSGRTKNAQELKLIMQQKQKMKGVQRFMRVGFAYPDGTYYGSDGTTVNIGRREYFHQSMQGMTVITGVLNDAILPNIKINVISTPVRNEANEIEGVVVETFANSELMDILSRGYVAEIGDTMVVNEVGEFVAARENLAMLFKNKEVLRKISGVYENKRLKNSLRDNKPQYVGFDNNKGLHMFYAPLGLWGVADKLSAVVFVKEEYLQQQLYFYRNNVLKMSAVMIALAFLALVYYGVDVRKQQKKLEMEIAHVALVDDITEGDNYAAFVRKMNQKGLNGYLAVLTIANFSIIQSFCGYKKSDELVKKIYIHMQRILRPEDELGHIHGADFVMFIDTEDEVWLGRQVRLVNQYLAELAEREDTPNLVAYFGFIKYDKKVAIREMVSKARVALASVLAKREEKYAVYGEKYIQEFLENSQLEKNFDRYIAAKQFEVLYQPKFDPFINAVMGAEALIRLRDDEGKLIPPYKFIPLFESDGLIRYLDKYVFQTVCEMQKQRLDAGLPVIPVSVNLSRATLHYPHIVEEYTNIIESFDLPIKLVPLEITESATVDNKDICILLDKFSVRGFNLHMDDFGSGYSSLAALNILPFSTMKIDKSLVDYIGGYSGNELIKHIVSLAKRLHMHVTVEGVETKEQVEFLKTINCHSIQGYYYSKPLEYKAFAELLENTPVKVMIR